MGRIALFLAAIAAALVAASPVAAQPQRPEGDWLGTMGPAQLHLAVHIRRSPAGLGGTLDSLDQGALGIPLAAVKAEGDALAFDVPAVDGHYAGRWDAQAARYDGEWSQPGLRAPLFLTRGTAAPPRRPQMPQRPYPYREVEVSYDNPAGHNRLAGTLTLPQGKGPFPAALLITGSGLQDRDETLMGHKPFLVLADYLTRRGIAVLRVDDRSIGGSTGDAKGTTLDFATDVEAGVRFLLARPEIDPRRVGLIGHSEGGVIAPIVGARSGGVAWIVLMAGPGLPGDRIIAAQQRLLMAVSGVPKEVIDRNGAVEERLLAAVKNAPDAATAQRDAKAILLETGMIEANAEANARSFSSDWYRTFLGLDPAPALRKVRVPVLALLGSLDLQVPAADNAPALRAALAGNRDAAVVVLPGLNHLFQTARTGSVAEYGQIEETLSPVALKTIGDWIAAHVR